MPFLAHRTARGAARLLSPAALLLLAASSALAQETAATGAGAASASRASREVAGAAVLTGVVVDEADAAVPGARVALRDAAGRVVAEALSTDVGRFLLERLAPGSYTLAVQREGFATTEIRNVPLKADGRLALRAPLKVGQLRETVTVEAASSVVNNAADAGTTVNRQLAENLPLNGRSLQPLIQLAPGLVPVRPTFAGQGQFSAGGQRPGANYFIVDGVSANIGVAAGADGLGQSGAGALPPFGALGTTHALAPADSLQELKVITGPYAAEYGRTPGAQVLIQTRGGANRWRGTLYEYFRHGALDARDWFANSRAIAPQPPLRNDDFGGAVGGPLAPGRAFLFASYEGVRAKLPAVGSFDVPSLAARAAAPAGVRPFLEAFPLPNAGEESGGLATYHGAYPNTARVDSAGLRVDGQAGDRVSLFARYAYAGSEARTRGVYNSANTILRMSFATHAATFGATYADARGTTNELRLNYGRTHGAKFFLLDDFAGAVAPARETLFPDGAEPAESVFFFAVGGGASFAQGQDSANQQRQLNLVNHLSVFRGSHQLKLGGDYRRMTPTYGRWGYKHVASFETVAAAVSGLASSVVVGSQDDVRLLFDNVSAYAQDTWRVGPSLSLTYGVRWELVPPPRGRGGQDLYTVRGLEDPSALALAPRGTPFYETSYANFAPRFGAAYMLPARRGWERVVRGGFGVYYDLGTGALANSATSYPHERARFLYAVPYPLSGELRLPPAPGLGLPALRIQATDPRLKLPYTLRWGASLEQALGGGRSVTASYVGAAGRRLLRMETLYYPTPDFWQVFVTTNAASSDYRALELQFTQGLSKSLQALVSYTFSRSDDDASNDWSPNPPGSRLDPRLDRGPSDFDVRHSLAAAVTYDLPRPPRALGPFGRALLGGWSVDQLLFARSAAPVEVFHARDFGFGPFNFRPDVVAGEPFQLADPTAPGGRRLNRAAFAAPGSARHGTLARNSLRGFPFTQLDLSLRRRLSLTERVSLQLRADFFNLFNHPNFGDPVGDLASPRFGRSVSTLGRSLNSAMGSVGLSHAYQGGGARAAQLSLKLSF